MKKKTTEHFIIQAQQVHGFKYDYSKTEYTGCKNKVCIICKEHGEFWQTPDNHVNSKHGCPKCANNINLTTEEFIQKAKIIHGSKYDYSNVSYLNNHTGVIINCPIHGSFIQLPLNHLKGEGCYECGRIRTNESKKVPVLESIEKAKLIHGNLYDYSKVTYNKVSDKVIIICPIHGEFQQTMNNHLNGQGCPHCLQSKGEKLITNWLNDRNITYISQYKIDIDFQINKSGTAFIDFYLPDYNCFIEYNGEQHYIAKERFGGDLEFQRQCKRDTYVRNYCNKHKIKLIEIKYDENVNNKLNDEL